MLGDLYAIRVMVELNVHKLDLRVVVVRVTNRLVLEISELVTNKSNTPKYFGFGGLTSQLMDHLVGKLTRSEESMNKIFLFVAQ